MVAAQMTRTGATLSASEIEQFHRLGYLGPFAAVTPEEMRSIRTCIEQDVLTTEGPNKKNRVQCRHLDQRVVYDPVHQPGHPGAHAKPVRE